MENIVFLAALLTMPVICASLLNRVNGKEVVSPRFAACLGLALVLFTTGVTHFTQTDGMKMLLPPWVPGTRELILATGVLEIMAAIGLIVERASRFTARGLIFFFIGIFPANIWAAYNYIDFGGHSFGPTYLLMRGPLQLLLIFWSWRIGRFRELPGEMRYSSPSSLVHGLR